MRHPHQLAFSHIDPRSRGQANTKTADERHGPLTEGCSKKHFVFVDDDAGVLVVVVPVAVFLGFVACVASTDVAGARNRNSDRVCKPAETG